MNCCLAMDALSDLNINHERKKLLNCLGFTGVIQLLCMAQIHVCM